MKFISWNVNGINACARKGLADFIRASKADFYLFQEIKATPDKSPQEITHLPGYRQYWNPAKRPGYSGTLILAKQEPFKAIKGIDSEKFDSEGRVLTLEYKSFYLINAYFPHSSRELKRLAFKLEFNKAFALFCKGLAAKKPVIIGSDFNVAHREIDLRNPKPNEKNAGFTEDERAWFGQFLDSGNIDTFRVFTQDGGHYTWWSWRNNARQRNIGWRIDYFTISKSLLKRLKSARILETVMGSDHCPISMEIE